MVWQSAWQSVPFRTRCKDKVGILHAGVYNLLLNSHFHFPWAHSFPGLVTWLLLSLAWSSRSFAKIPHRHFWDQLTSSLLKACLHLPPVSLSFSYSLMPTNPFLRYISLPCLSLFFLLFNAHKSTSKGWGLEPHKPEGLGDYFCFPTTQPQFPWLKQKECWGGINTTTIHIKRPEFRWLEKVCM